MDDWLDRRLGQAKRASVGVKALPYAGKHQNTMTQDVHLDADLGTLIMNPGGYGFVQRSAPLDSVFVPPHRLAGAIDGDRVRIKSWDAAKGTEGEVLEILSRRRKKIVGVLVAQGERGYSIEPDDGRIVHRVSLTDRPSADARLGQLVSGTIVQYPMAGDPSILVSFDQVIGDPGNLKVEVQKTLLENAIEEGFPAEALDEAKKVPKKVRVKDRKGRVDLTELPFMTIDPPDARDFDDAVCVQFEDRHDPLGEATLYVAVADVSHYVRPGSAIDEHAQERCFSVYLPDRSIPMLPRELSSHMCSLVPNEDRLAMVAKMRIDAGGRVIEREVIAGVIHSQKRLTYAQAAAVLDETPHRLSEAEVQRIQDLRSVADRLRKLRLQRGALELSLPDSKVILDQDDPERIRDIVHAKPSKSITRAYNLIEELMLAANEAVGELAVEHKLPVLFRSHDAPNLEKLEQLAASAAQYDIVFEPEAMQEPRAVQKLISKLRGHELSSVLQILLLRCMAQAVYSPDHKGHFALASPAYVHFTSPIRRYADLISHRVFKSYLQKKGEYKDPISASEMPSREQCEEAARESSEQERQIMQVERGIKSIYAAAFMKDKIGERYPGQISGFNNHGAFVMLQDPRVDGFIVLNPRDQPRQYELDPSGTIMKPVGRGGGIYELGQHLEIEVLEASMLRRQIELRSLTQPKKPKPTERKPLPKADRPTYARPSKNPGKKGKDKTRLKRQKPGLRKKSRPKKPKGTVGSRRK